MIKEEFLRGFNDAWFIVEMYAFEHESKDKDRLDEALDALKVRWADIHEKWKAQEAAREDGSKDE